MRSIQLKRSIASIGLLRSLILVLFTVYLQIIISYTINNTNKALYLTLAYAAILFSIQMSRRDINFLKLTVRNEKYILGVDMCLLSLPIIIPLALFYHWKLLILLMLLICLFITFNRTFQVRNTWVNLLHFLPNNWFEIRVGIRERFLFIAILFAFWIFMISFKWATPLFLFLWGIIQVSFYEKNEPYQMILAYEKNQFYFLRTKVIVQIKFFVISILPFVVMYTLFHWQQLYIVLIECFIIILLHVFIINVKYAFYQDGNNVIIVKILFLIGILFLVFPILSPLFFVAIPYFAHRAIKRLNFYLYDYN